MCYTEITIFTLQDQGEKTGIIRSPKSHTHTPLSKLLTGGINFRFWPIFISVLYVLCTSKTSTKQFVPLVKRMSRATSLHTRNNVLDRFRFQKKGNDQFTKFLFRMLSPACMYLLAIYSRVCQAVSFMYQDIATFKK